MSFSLVYGLDEEKYDCCLMGHQHRWADARNFGGFGARRKALAQGSRGDDPSVWISGVWTFFLFGQGKGTKAWAINALPRGHGISKCYGTLGCMALQAALTAHPANSRRPKKAAIW